MSVSITLRYHTSVDDPTTAGAAQYVKFDVTAQTGMADDAIFVYQREANSPDTGTPNSRFSNVACPADLAELQVGEPADSDHTTLLFRLNYFEAYLRSRKELDQLIVDVESDVNLLKQSLDLKTEHLADPVSTTF
jgi:hypothetical protein